MNGLDFYQKMGFEGFKSVRELMQNIELVPNKKGIYLVFFPDEESPVFVEKGSGGFFKGKNPNVSINDLKKQWVEDERLLYIGKAGRANSKATLQSRLKQYMRFGQGEPVGHWGGRLIWQLANAKDLIVCWKILGVDKEPREEERKMILNFKTVHNGKRPFANLQD